MSDDDKTSNVIPEQELNFRRKLSECSDEIAQAIVDMVERVQELRDIQAPVDLWCDQVIRRLPEAWEARLDSARHAVPMVVDQAMKLLAGEPVSVSDVIPIMAGLGAFNRQAIDDEDDEPDAMYRMIQRLFAEAPKLTGNDGQPVPDQAPALECVIMLKPGAVMRGVLSETPEGSLRMMSPHEEKGRPMMVEQFFCYDDVLSIALVRDVKVTSGSIIS